ncbi:GAF sensor signal transduction histidine kinase [Rubrobacter xylanophilus DSM 9941]|uniref:GAF sensor signal transduction histidine kinase n=1 Tax=Rubrobacter xylanophilus (strain DSM 9941 / JCM 11954 / NBRC 16129 / PRD-1) TaxID=266117 RepID=Q1ASU9_RUBXD|nr:GAF domain-containing sensor histidine kinase [Rubrobacter xylanophilus]ABG05529.1 GAF sensor signal transduction histidine kinase [Rubrobacter xylanophilus DSM 9941]
MTSPGEEGPETQDLERRNRELAAVNAVARELNRSVDLQEALRFTLARVAELLGLKTGWVWLMDGGEPYLAATMNLPSVLAENPPLMDGSRYCYCLDTYKKGDLLEGAANVNVLACSRLSGLVDGTDGLRYHASIPLYSGETKLGVMNVASHDWRSLSREDLRLLYTIGDLLSIAVERARLFARSALLGASEERNRLAREIHDTIAQGLAATALRLETAEALLEAGSPAEARKEISRALALTRTNLEEARRSVLDLRAAPLEGRSLAEALALLAESQERESGIPVRFRAVNGARPLPPRVETGLYRICQEALNNAARHAEASRIEVLLTLTPGEARLRVEDDGRGLDPSPAPPGRHGILGMRERARLLGGRLEISEAPGGGARVEAAVPLEG